MGDYVGPIYEAPGPVYSFHGVPRFGHLSNVTDIFSPDETIDAEKLNSYIMGTIFIPAFLLVSYFIFLILIIGFKFCCKMGDTRILAGLPFLEDEDLDDDSRTTKRGSKFEIVLRGLVLLGTFVVIINGFIFLGKGTQNIRAVANDIREGTEGFMGLTTKVVDNADSFITLGDQSAAFRESLFELIGTGVCNVFEPENVESNPIDGQIAVIVDALEGLDSFALNYVKDIKNAFEQDMKKFLQDIDDETNDYERRLNPAHYAGPAITFGIVLMIGVILAWLPYRNKIYFGIQTWVMMPLFFVFISVSIIIIAIVGVVLAANSDLCIGNPTRNPEGSLAVLAQVFLDEPTNHAIDYYFVTGCRGEYGELGELKKFIPDLRQAKEFMQETLTYVSSNQIILEVACGGGAGSLTPLVTTLEEGAVLFDDLLDVGANATEVLNCEEINQLWVDIVHDGLCYHAPLALSWMFSSMLAIYIGGMLIFIFRGALLPTELVPSGEYSKGLDNINPKAQAGDVVELNDPESTKLVPGDAMSEGIGAINPEITPQAQQEAKDLKPGEKVE